MPETPKPDTLARALDAWRRALGEDQVRIDAPTLARAQCSTFDRSFEIAAILSPRSTREVREALRIATETAQPVHVVSTGRNWGLGARQPVHSPSVLIELSRMNRILEFDPQLALITVQPGVTFAQVDAFLEAKGANLFLAQTGGSPQASPIANALERGDGNGPYGDRANAVAGLELVLPTGEVLRPGFGRFGAATLSKTHRNGVGPSLDGLFFQSNLGVVTEATLWLQTRPAFPAMGYWEIGDDRALPPFIDAVRSLMQRGVLQAGSFSVWNRYKRLAAEMSYPFDATEGRTPLPPQFLGDMAVWSATCSLYAESRPMVDALKSLISEATRGLVQSLEFIEADTLPPDEAEDVFGWYSTGANLRTAYWRKRDVPTGPLDPDRDGCGVIWLCPAAPFIGETVLDIFTLSERIGLAHGFEPHLGLNPISPRALNLFIALMFDMDMAGESARAMRCHDDLIQTLVDRGHLPYRLSAHAMDVLPPVTDDSAAVIRSLKARCDPGGILDPGRYGIVGPSDHT